MRRSSTGDNAVIPMHGHSAGARRALGTEHRRRPSPERVHGVTVKAMMDGGIYVIRDYSENEANLSMS